MDCVVLEHSCSVPTVSNNKIHYTESRFRKGKGNEHFNI